MDTLRNDLTPVIGSSLDDESSAHEAFLLEEGLEMLARYRAIGDPRMRLLIRQLVTVIAEEQAPKQ